MKKPRTTPGPWKIQADPTYEEGTHPLHHCRYSSQQADAQIIAAAPDLLEACENVVAYHREHDSGEGELFGLDFITTCISAIKKAKGE